MSFDSVVDETIQLRPQYRRCLPEVGVERHCDQKSHEEPKQPSRQNGTCDESLSCTWLVTKEEIASMCDKQYSDFGPE